MTDADDVAIIVRLGRLDARKVRVKGVRSDGSSGDGFMLRDATVVLEDVEVRDAGGAGVVATAVANVDLKGLRCEGCVHGALVVERKATVKARGVVSVGAREAAVSLPDDAPFANQGEPASASYTWVNSEPGSSGSFG